MSGAEVELHQPAAPVVSSVSAAELDVLMRQSEMLAQSTIVPTAYRRQPANILVAALTGRSFGWDVMTAMRNGHVIEGTWSIKPEAMLALVRRAGHSVSGETSPDGATVTGRRCDTGDEMTVSFTLDDARRAKLASKAVWQQYPQAMCWARAVSQLCRMLFPDVTLGLALTPEELGAEVDSDGTPIDARVVEPAPVVHKTDAEVSAAAREAFDAYYDEAPEGRKTKVLDRLRHAVIYAATRGRTASLRDCTGEDRDAVYARLLAIAQGKVMVDANPLDDAAGVTFVTEKGDVTFLWSEIEMARGEATEEPEPAGAPA